MRTSSLKPKPFPLRWEGSGRLLSTAPAESEEETEYRNAQDGVHAIQHGVDTGVLTVLENPEAESLEAIHPAPEDMKELPELPHVEHAATLEVIQLDELP